MKWPTHTDYQDAIQNPPICFSAADLKAGAITNDMLGLPRVMSGNFASVYELTTPQGHWAIRCFVRQVMGQQGRYARLSQHLSNIQLEWIVKFEYLLKGILVQGEWYPIVQMEWVKGQQLNTYVEDHLQEAETLLHLTQKWRVMLRHLRDHRIAHGDLQHGNIMVTAEGDLRLVDYDGMYCPAFGRTHSPELGHANFQHPRRTPDYYEERLDNFAAIGIHLCFLALAKEPDLWSQYNIGDNLLFTAADFKNTHNSGVFNHLKGSSDPIVRGLAELLQQCCIAPIACTPWYEDAIQAAEKGTLAELIATVKAQSEGTAPISPPAEPWIEKKPAPPAAPAEPKPAAAPVPAVEEVTQIYRPPEPARSGDRKTLWLGLAAALAVIAAVASWAIHGLRQKPAAALPPPPVTAPTNPTPATPEAALPSAPAKPAQVRPATAIAGAIKVNALRTLSPQVGAITWVGFSPNGRLVATGGEDGTIKLWDPSSGQAKQTLPGQGDGVHAAFFLPDGKTLVSVSSDNTVRFWNVGTAQLAKTVSDYTKNLWAVSVSPDGLWLATGATDRKIVRLLETQTGALKRMLSQHASWVRSVDFSPDASLAAVSCWDDTVKLWVAASGEARGTLPVVSNTVEKVVFSPDAKLVAAGGMGKTATLWDVQTAKLKQALVGHSGDVKCCAFSSNGKLIATGAEDNTVGVWNVANGQLRSSFSGHSGAVTAVAFSEDGSFVVSGSADQSVKLWDVTALSQ